MTIWSSQPFLKRIGFLPFTCTAYFKKSHLSAREVYKPDGMLSYLYNSFPRIYGWSCFYQPCVEPAAQNGFSAVHTLSKFALNRWGEKLSAKSKFSLRNRRPWPLVGFHSAEDREVCFQFAGGRSSSPWRNVGNNTSQLESQHTQGSASLTPHSTPLSPKL